MRGYQRWAKVMSQGKTSSFEQKGRLVDGSKVKTSPTLLNDTHSYRHHRRAVTCTKFRALSTPVAIHRFYPSQERCRELNLPKAVLPPISSSTANVLQRRLRANARIRAAGSGRDLAKITRCPAQVARRAKSAVPCQTPIDE